MFKLIESFRRSSKDLRTQLADLERQEQALRHRRDVLQAQPAAKADIKAMLLAWLDAMGGDYPATLQASLKQFITRPVVSIPADGRAPMLHMISPVGAAMPPASNLVPGDLDRLFAALFRDQMRAALLAAVDAMQWDEGPTLAARAAELERLDTEIRAINEQQAAFASEAMTAGLSLRNPLS